MTEDNTPVAKGISSALGKLYEKQIEQQLGVELQWTGNNGEHLVKNFGRVEVSASRREDWNDNQWHLFVRFGDDGFNVDPGVYAVSKQKAIKEIEEAIESLKKAGAWITNNIKDDNGKSD